MVVAEWLAALRAAPIGGIALLDLGKASVTRNDEENFIALLRCIRTCRALVVAKVHIEATQLSWLDFAVCLSADVVVANVDKDNCPIDCFGSGEAEEAVLKDMWADTVGSVYSECDSYPSTVLQLRKAHLLSSEEEVSMIRGSHICRMPQFLSGFRRAGGHRMKKIDKSGFNFYWVTKVLVLNSLPPFDEGSPNSKAFRSVDCLVHGDIAASGKVAMPHAISVVFDERAGVLKLELRAEIMNMSAADICASLSPWVKDTRVTFIEVVIPGASEPWLRRILPAEAVEKNISAYKWYRKWDSLLSQLVGLAPLQCELQGPAPPALLELFFASKIRCWTWESKKVGFHCSGFLPGAAFFSAQRHLGRAATRRLLVQGFSLAEALELGIINSTRRVVNCEPQTSRHVQDLPCRAPILSLLQNRRIPQSIQNAPVPEHLPVLANLVGMSLTLPGKQHEMSQMQVCERLGLKGTSLQQLFEADHIQTRTLAQIGETGFGFHSPRETSKGIDKLAPGQGALTHKHLRWARAMMVDAVKAACHDAGQPLTAVRYVSVCSSSGYLLPGLTSYVINDLKLPRGTVRCDIVGMGCHAGLNSLQAAANWAALHPGQLAISIGVEVLSAHFMWSETLRSEHAELHRLNHALCNSLFSDGCFAVALMRPTANIPAMPCYATLHEFASQTSSTAMHTMTYQWNDLTSQFWFFLSEEAPYAVGAALQQLLHDQQDSGMPIEQVVHYVMHTGGQTVIDSAAAALGLDAGELKPTKSALRKFGNNSSVSFMFGYGEFLESSPCPVVEGDLGVFITMGPGAGFELCLWSAGVRSTRQEKRATHILQRVADPPWELGTPGNTKAGQAF